MTITLLIIIITNCLNMLITGILIIRQMRANKKKVKKNGKKRAKKTKKAKAKVTHGNAETPSKKAVSDQKKGRKTKKTMKVDASAFDAETLKAYSEAIAYQDAMKAENSVLPSYDKANMGHQPEVNLDPDDYIKNMPKMNGAK